MTFFSRLAASSAATMAAAAAVNDDAGRLLVALGGVYVTSGRVGSPATTANRSRT